MIIGFDLDDTITNTNQVLTDFIEKNENIRPVNLDEFDLQKRYNIDENTKKNFLKKYYKKSIINCTIRDGFKKCIDILNNEGDSVLIISSRPNSFRNKQITKKWLKQNNIKYSKLCLGIENKAKSCSENSVMLYIDDSVKHCENISETGIKTLCYSTLCNEKYSNPLVKRIKYPDEIIREKKQTCPFKYYDSYRMGCHKRTKRNYRYLDVMGGSKNVRYFLVPENFPRNEFNNRYQYVLPKCLIPIYDHKGIKITQDNSFAVPGFYIISFEKQFASIKDLPDLLVKRSSLLLKYLRKGLFESLGIKYTNIYYEEKISKSCNIHVWIVPKLGEFNFNKKLYDIKLNKYLKSFKYLDTKEQMSNYNNIMRDYFEKINLQKIDDML